MKRKLTHSIFRLKYFSGPKSLDYSCIYKSIVYLYIIYEKEITTFYLSIKYFVGSKNLRITIVYINRLEIYVCKYQPKEIYLSIKIFQRSENLRITIVYINLYSIILWNTPRKIYILQIVVVIFVFA